MGFFADITTDQIFSCFQKNYFSAAYITHALLKRWLEKPADPAIVRHIVFTNSTVALVTIPGYVAYTPTKAALRALADTLRQEVLLYKSQQTIQIHSLYLGSILTDTFLTEQEHKPALCIDLEGSESTASYTTPEAAAKAIMTRVERGEFCSTFDLNTRLLLNNMRGPSPANTYVWDWILGVVASWVWPFFRISWDRRTIKYGLKHKTPPNNGPGKAEQESLGK